MTHSGTLLLTCLISVFASRAVAVSEPSALDSDQTSLPLQQMFESGDAAQVDKAVASMRAQLDRVVWVRHHSGDVPKDELSECIVRYHTLAGVLPSVLLANRFDDLEEFALKLMLVTPGGVSVVELERYQKLRVLGKLAAGKPQEALTQAKSLYNICSMQDTSQAIEIVGDCLFDSHKVDQAGRDKAVALIRQFRQQQAEGAIAPAGRGPATAPIWLLRDVQVDDAPYRDEISALRMKRSASALIGLGNLLLLSDKPTDAEDCFQRARSIADKQIQMNQATEGVARSMRAEDGAVGRANAWVVSLQAQADAKTVPANP